MPHPLRIPSSPIVPAWRRWCAWLLVFACSFGSARGEGRTVARLELAAPISSPFVLRAVVPIEPGVFPRPDGRSPFFVRMPGKDVVLVPAQAEIVSRRPDGSADVVEVVARAELDPKVRAGARITCGLVLDEPPPRTGTAEVERPLTSAAVAALLDPTARGRVFLRTRDVYGNLYAAELNGNPEGEGFGSRRVLKQGVWLEETRVHATLVPIAGRGGDGPPLPHMMGAHAYWTHTSIDDTVELALRVHNGSLSGAATARGTSPEDAARRDLEMPLGIVYWSALELVVPKGWIVVPEVADPFFGEAYEENDHVVVPLVKRLDGGALHMMGPQAQFERRLRLAPAAGKVHATARPWFEGLSFPTRREGLWSWSNPATGRYFPQRSVLASVDFLQRDGSSGKEAARRADARALGELRAGLEAGTARGWYVQSGVMGWAHPWFLQEQGGVGGEGISTFEGHYAAQGASREGVAYLSLLHRMNVCRQNEAAYDSRGDVVGYHELLDEQGRIPFDFRTNGGIVIPCFRLPMRQGPPPSAQVLEVVRRGLRPPYDKGTPFENDGAIPYDGNLLSWWPHDDQHLVRYTKNAKALVWLANDSMAKDDLILSAELFHLMFHESPHVPADWSPGVTLRVYEDIARRSPHAGLPWGREHAWGIDAMCAAYSVGSPRWRGENRAWFDRVTDLLERSAMPSGLLQRALNERFLGHTRYHAAQTFEELFLVHAMRCLAESVYRDVDEARRAQLGALARRGIDYLFFGPPWQRIPAGWQPDPAHPTIFFQGPRQGVAVAMNDERVTPVFSDAKRWGPNYLPPDGLGGGVEIHTIWPALQYVAEWTQDSAGKGLDNRYLRRALDCWTPHADFAALAAAFREQASDPSQDNSANWIGILALLQNLGVR